MRISFGTDIGMVREKNEDCMIVIENDNLLLAAVADGMGGHRSGQKASRICCDEAKLHFDLINGSPDTSALKEIMQNIFKHSSDKIIKESEKMEISDGMGTTLNILIMDKTSGETIIGNVGDSRTYIISSKKISQITKDHTLVQTLIDEGTISIEESSDHPQKNILTKAVGINSEISPDIYEIKVQDDDIILICSDGLTEYLKDEEIMSFVDEKKEDTAKILIKEANNRGGSDNITVVIIYI